MVIGMLALGADTFVYMPSAASRPPVRKGGVSNLKSLI
jgi:hypothetical protein